MFLMPLTAGTVKAISGVVRNYPAIAAGLKQAISVSHDINYTFSYRIINDRSMEVDVNTRSGDAGTIVGAVEVQEWHTNNPAILPKAPIGAQALSVLTYELMSGQWRAAVTNCPITACDCVNIKNNTVCIWCYYRGRRANTDRAVPDFGTALSFWSEEVHKADHLMLYNHLLTLVADFEAHTSSISAITPIRNLLVWASEQANAPTAKALINKQISPIKPISNSVPFEYHTYSNMFLANLANLIGEANDHLAVYPDKYLGYNATDNTWELVVADIASGTTTETTKYQTLLALIEDLKLTSSSQVLSKEAVAFKTHRRDFDTPRDSIILNKPQCTYVIDVNSDDSTLRIGFHPMLGSAPAPIQYKFMLGSAGALDVEALHHGMVDSSTIVSVRLPLKPTETGKLYVNTVDGWSEDPIEITV